MTNYSKLHSQSTELRNSCVRVIESSQVPYRTLHAEARRLRPLVNAGRINVHEAWHELLVAAVVAGVPARDAATILRDSFKAAVEVLP